MRAKKIVIGVIFYILFLAFMAMTADVIKNPESYDTVAAYHATLEENA